MLVGKMGQVQKAEHLLFVVVCSSFSAPRAPAFLCTAASLGSGGTPFISIGAQSQLHPSSFWKSNTENKGSFEAAFKEFTYNHGELVQSIL